MSLTLRTFDSIYLSIFAGYMVQKVDHGTAGSFQRTNANNQLVNELRFNSLTGHVTEITKIDPKDEKFDFQFRIMIWDGKQKYALHVPASGGTAFRLFTKLFMAKLSDPVTIDTQGKPIDGDKDGKLSTHFFVNQNGTSLKALWTKDNKRSLPDLDKVTFKGKEAWDDSKQMAYIEQFIKEKIAPQFIKITTSDGPKDDTEQPDVTAPLQQQASAPKAPSNLGQTAAPAAAAPAPTQAPAPTPAPVAAPAPAPPINSELPPWLQ